MRACSNASIGCTGELGDNSEHSECYNCRHYVQRWRKRSPSDVRERYRCLQVWEHRIEAALPKRDRESNITPMRKRA